MHKVKSVLQKNRILVLSLLIVFLLTLPALFPLFRSGFFQTDDGEWMIIRFSAFHQALRDGQFPVRFLGRLNHSFGYPVANFLYPGYMYLAEPIHILGFGFVDTIKIVLGGAMSASGVFCFLWLRKRFTSIASIVGSVFYVYTPYHLYDVYKRGSVGEVLALAVVPFILWQIERKSLFWQSIGIGFLILSHNTLAVFFVPILFFYALLLQEKKQLRDLCLPFLFGFGLASFFWLPAIVELPQTKFIQTPISNISGYFVDTNLVGVSSLILVGIAIAMLRRVEGKTVKRLTFYFLLLSVLSIFFSTAYSEPFWGFLPSGFIQFPFRLLSLMIVGVAFIAAALFTLLQKIHLIPFGILLLIALIYSAVPFMQPKIYFDKGDGFYSTNEDSTTVKNEYMPKWVNIVPTEHASAKVLIKHGEIANEVHKTNKSQFSISGDGKTVVEMQTVYYPGWKAFVNNKEVPIDYTNEKGLIQFPVTAKQAHVTVSFHETPLRIVANSLSLGSLIGLIMLLIQHRVNSRKRKSTV